MREDLRVLYNHPEIVDEQAYIDHAYRRLETIRTNLRETLREAYEIERGGTFQSRAERDIIVRATLDRLERLEFGSLALCFGRIDRLADLDIDSDRFYIGRIAVADHDMEPLVVDWRAPIAEPFYRATAREPMGINLRRHFESKHGVLVGIEDEPLNSSLAEVDEDHLSGAGALFYAMNRARTGHMGDIVATIQAEQDAIIRSPLSGVMVVQGGPGTGKTAVALHRAAYLLYTYRNRLESQGVLVIAPSSKFARYIAKVLPSLGETGVEIATLASLADVKETITHASVAEARLKANERMVRFIAKAIKDRERALVRDLGFYLGSIQLWVTVEMSRKAVTVASRRPGTHNERQRIVEVFLARQLAKLYIRFNSYSYPESNILDQSNAGKDGLLGEPSADYFLEAVDPSETDEDVLREVERTIRSEADFQQIVGRIWPKLTSVQLFNDLYSHEALCRLAGKGILETWEVDLMRKGYRKGYFSRADLPLLDEAAIELGPTSKKRAVEDIRKFGHIVVDEAQELSFMEARMLSRRSISSSITLVGDIAQTTSPHGQRSWDKIIKPLAISVSEWKYRQLNVNYRMPTEIADLAYKLFSSSDVKIDPSISIRSSGFDPILQEVSGDIFDDLASYVSSDLASEPDGLVGVLLSNSSDVSLVKSNLASKVPSLDRVDVLNFEDAKGLEFDSVIVVGPTQLVEDVHAERSALFTAMTRATKRLTILYEAKERKALIELGIVE